MGLLRRRPAAYTPADETVTVHRPGAEPVGAFAAAVLDGSFGHRLDGSTGHVGLGFYGSRVLGELGRRQAFVGAAQLQNKLAGAVGNLNTAAPASKPQPDSGVPVTAMQRVLGQVTG